MFRNTDSRRTFATDRIRENFDFFDDDRHLDYNFRRVPWERERPDFISRFDPINDQQHRNSLRIPRGRGAPFYNTPSSFQGRGQFHYSELTSATERIRGNDNFFDDRRSDYNFRRVPWETERPDYISRLDTVNDQQYRNSLRISQSRGAHFDNIPNISQGRGRFNYGAPSDSWERDRQFYSTTPNIVRGRDQLPHHIPNIPWERDNINYNDTTPRNGEDFGNIPSLFDDRRQLHPPSWEREYQSIPQDFERPFYKSSFSRKKYSWKKTDSFSKEENKSEEVPTLGNTAEANNPPVVKRTNGSSVVKRRSGLLKNGKPKLTGKYIYTPPRGEPGGRDDPNRKGLSGAGQRWYVRYLLSGMSSEEAKEKAWSRRTLDKRQNEDNKTGETGSEKVTEQTSVLLDETAEQINPQDNVSSQVSLCVNTEVDLAKKPAEASGTKIVVHPENYPYEMLGIEELTELEKCIAGEMFKGACNTLQFNGIKFNQGYIIVDCTNTETIDWFVTKVSNLSEWKGKKLSACLDGQFQERKYISIRFPNHEGKDSDVLLTLLGTQNAGLSTNSWKILHKEQEGSDTVVSLQVDSNSVEYIRNNGGSVFYRFGKIKVDDHGSLRGNPGTLDQPLMEDGKAVQSILGAGDPMDTQ